MTILFLFIANSAVMILEIVGARAFAPFLGTSTEVWAGLIATVLAGLTIGYHFGGKVTDKVLTKNGSLNKLVVYATLTAGILIIITWSLIDFIAIIAAGLSANFGLTIATCIVTLVAFVPATICLASLSPIIARIRLKNLSGAGSVIGSLSAISASGSIFGSLSAGIIFIPYFGSKETLIGIGILLCVIAVAFSIHTKSFKWTAVIFIFVTVSASLVAFTGNIFINGGYRGETIADIDTRYQRLWIFDSIDGRTGRSIRGIHTDPFGTQCAMFKDEIIDESPKSTLVFSYTKAFDEALSYAVKSLESVNNITVIGGCNFSYPTHLSYNFPEAHITVSELDPKFEEISKSFFGFSLPQNMSIINGDARNFFHNRNDENKKADIVFYDAYNSFTATPFQLVTVESFRNVEKNMSEDGVLIMNAIGGITDDSGRITSSLFSTLKQVFANVDLYQIIGAPYSQAQNLIIIASNNVVDIDQDKSYLTRINPKILHDEPIILTDNFAPIERLTKPLRDSIVSR